MSKSKRLQLIWLILFCMGCTESSPTNATPTPILSPLPPTTAHFQLRGRHLYDGCGEKVVLRGINHMTYFMEPTGLPSYNEIAKTGANVVRIMWMLEGSADDLDVVLTNARNAQLIPMIELHDATGRWEMLPKLVDYWVRPDIVAVLQAHQAYLLLNIGNEVGGYVKPETFQSGYQLAVQRMREANLRMPLVIDAPGEGRDIDTLQATFANLIEADPDHNLLFSIHTWWWASAGYSAETIRTVFAKAAADEMPLIVGEFAARWTAEAGGEIPYQAILEEAQRHQIGYLAWSWGGEGDKGNSYPKQFLDMTTSNTFETLFGWGKEVALTSPYSIKNTSIRPYSMVTGHCR